MTLNEAKTKFPTRARDQAGNGKETLQPGGEATLLVTEDVHGARIMRIKKIAISSHEVMTGEIALVKKITKGLPEWK